MNKVFHIILFGLCGIQSHNTLTMLKRLQRKNRPKSYSTLPKQKESSGHRQAETRVTLNIRRHPSCKSAEQPIAPRTKKQSHSLNQNELFSRMRKESKGNSPLLKPSDRRNSLTKAAYVGDVKQLQKLLESGRNINQVDRNGDTPLTVAIENRQYKATELLLQNNANKQYVRGLIDRPLTIAVQNDDGKIVELLLQYETPVNEHNDDENQSTGSIALLKAVCLEKDHIARRLIEAGAQISYPDKDAAILAIQKKRYNLLHFMLTKLTKQQVITLGTKNTVTRIFNPVEKYYDPKVHAIFAQRMELPK